MSIVIGYGEARKAVEDAATPLVHPTKNYKYKGAPERVPVGREDGKHPFGRIVYYGHGDWANYVGAKIDGKYLVAQGDDHEDSIRQLAYHIGASKLDLGVPVEEVDEADFYARCLSS